MTEVNDRSPHSESTRPSSVRFIVLIWLCGVAAIAYLQRNALSIVQGSVQKDLGLDDSQMGWVYGLFFLSYGLFQIPSGLLGDRWGSRIAIPVLSSLWSLATLLTAAIGWIFVALRSGADSLPAQWVLFAFLGMASARLLAGAAQAGVFPCSAVVVHRWFPKSHWAFATGWLSSFQHVGAMIATFGTALLVRWQIPWQTMFVVYSVPGFLWAVAFYLWYRNRPADHPRVNDAELAILGTIRGAARELNESNLSKDKESVPWSVLLSSRTMWAFCAQQFFRAAAYNFYASWFPTYLEKTRGFSVSDAGMLTTLPVAATFLGTVSSGMISDVLLARTGSRRIARQGLSVTGVVLAAMFIFAAWFVKGPVAAVMVISAGSFCAAFAGPTSYALSIEMGGKHVSAVFGAMNMSGSIGALVFPVVVGYILELTGNWEAILLLFAGIYVAAAFFWLLFDPNGTVFDKPRPDLPSR